MTTAKVLYNTLVNKLSLPESADEISAVAFAVLQHLGVSRADVLTDREVKIEQSKFDTVVHRLNNHEPLQYIFNEAWFYGRKFFVDSRVLIPRPETELLIDIAKKNFSKLEIFSVLDIGTGSGCIAVTLALEFPNAKVNATDVSTAALQVAMQNAKAFGTKISFVQNDILKGFPSHSEYDLIVSNPPYIAQSEKNTMLANVLQYEPHLALFAAENDALIFYRGISETARGILSENGMLLVEINEKSGKETVQVFTAMGFSDVKIHKDLFGKERVITAKQG